MELVLYNSASGRYFAGSVSNAIVTTPHKEHAKVFDKKKDAKDKIEFLKNSGHPYFSIVEVK